MAIPLAYESEQVIAAKAQFEHAGLDGLKPLHDGDVLLLGQIILMFSFNELNLRRVIELLCLKGFLKTQKKFHTSELIEKVKAGIADAFPSDTQLANDLAMLSEIELRRPHRNMFAHWAARRLDGMDVIVFMTKDLADEKAATSLTTSNDFCTTFAVMTVNDVQALRNNVAQHGEWLAHRTHQWHVALGVS